MGSTRSPARIPRALPPGVPRLTGQFREIPGSADSPGLPRPNADKIREPASVLREMTQGFPPTLAVTDLPAPPRELCALFQPHLSSCNQSWFRSPTAQTMPLANLAR